MAAEGALTVWVDADACPVDIKEILFRTSRRLQLPLVLVANSAMRIPSDERIRLELVPSTADAADDHIAEHCARGDLVVTADIPLAARVVARGATGLNPRGELYTEENVEECLAMRNLMDELRSAEMVEGGPAPHSAADCQAIANALDRHLTQALQGDG